MRFVFGVPIAGNLIAMLFSTLVYVFALLSLGLARRNQSREPNASAADVDGLPVAERFLFRLHFPRETMPWIFYALGALFPTTYFIALMRAIILRGAHFFEYWPHLAILICDVDLAFRSLRPAVSKKIGMSFKST